MSLEKSVTELWQMYITLFWVATLDQRLKFPVFPLCSSFFPHKFHLFYKYHATEAKLPLILSKN